MLIANNYEKNGPTNTKLISFIPPTFDSKDDKEHSTNPSQQRKHCASLKS